jgi:hypothetical protein
VSAGAGREGGRLHGVAGGPVRRHALQVVFEKCYSRGGLRRGGDDRPDVLKRGTNRLGPAAGSTIQTVERLAQRVLVPDLGRKAGALGEKEEVVGVLREEPIHDPASVAESRLPSLLFRHLREDVKGRGIRRIDLDGSFQVRTGPVKVASLPFQKGGQQPNAGVIRGQRTRTLKMSGPRLQIVLLRRQHPSIHPYRRLARRQLRDPLHVLLGPVIFADLEGCHARVERRDGGFVILGIGARHLIGPAGPEADPKRENETQKNR